MQAFSTSRSFTLLFGHVLGMNHLIDTLIWVMLHLCYSDTISYNGDIKLIGACMNYEDEP